MYINDIGFLNTIYWHIMFYIASMIKNWKVKNIRYVIKHLNKLYLQRGFKITRIHTDSECEPLHVEMDDISIPLNFSSKKNMSLRLNN